MLLDRVRYHSNVCNTGQAAPPHCGQLRPVVLDEPSPQVVTEHNATECLFWRIQHCTPYMVHIITEHYTLHPNWTTNPSRNIINYTVDVNDSIPTNVSMTLVITMSDYLLNEHNYIRCKIFYGPDLDEVMFTKKILFSVRNDTTTHTQLTTTDCLPFSAIEPTDNITNMTLVNQQTTDSDVRPRPFLFLLTVLQCTVLLLHHLSLIM